MKILRIAPAVLLAMVVNLVLGCSGAADEPEEVGVTEEGLVAIDRSKPIILHYGFLQNGAVGSPGAPTSPNGALTARLRVPGVENVLVTTLPASDPKLRAWGGLAAYRAQPSELPTASAAAAAAFVRAKVEQGYAYVAVDEIEPSKAAKLQDTQEGGVLAEAMRILDGEPTYRQRVILFVNSYNMAGLRVSQLPRFSKVLRACRDYCRVLGSEVYLAASEAFLPGTPTASGCASGIRCIGYLAQRLDQVAPGLSKRTITVLDVRGRNLPGADLGSYCWGAKGGALRAEIAKVRELGQPGVGTYALSYVASDLDGVGQDARFDASVAKFAGCLHGLLAQRPFAAPR